MDTVTTVETEQFVGTSTPEPALGGLVLHPTGLTGDPAVLTWAAAVAASGRAW